MSHWEPYAPTKAAPWDLSRVVHLHRRVVFGGTWSELQRDLKDGPCLAVDRVLAGTVREAAAPAEFEALADLIGASAAESRNPGRLQAWWIFRCLLTPDPLTERLTLMWHNHFATSNAKVDSIQLMKQQNDVFRRYARGAFGELLQAMLRDPALLLWLDAPENRQGRPNENLARELMELFTLGIGNYNEQDVKHAARALTGLTVREGVYHQESRNHDNDEKTILGLTAEFDSVMLAKHLLKQPAPSQRLARRLVSEFFADGVVSTAAIDELADELHRNNLNIGSAVETLLRSQLFFSAANLHSRVCDPLTFLLAPLRAFECFENPPQTLLLADWLKQMGLNLFYPPNVGGWNGGRGWLNTRTVIARANYVAQFVTGQLHRPVTPPDLQHIARQHAVSDDLPAFARFTHTLFYGDHTANGTEWAESLSRPNSKARSSNEQSPEAQVVIHLLTRPQAHLH